MPRPNPRTTTRRARTVILVTAIALSACGVRSNLKPGMSTRTDSQSTILVLGAKAGHAIRIHSGEIEGAAWNFNFFPDPVARSWPDNDGYLVWKVAPLPQGSAYGVTQITVDDVGSPPRYFDLCNGSGTVTFEAPAGKVVYVGDLEFERYPDRSIGYRLASDEKGVREYLQKRYPALAAELVIGNSVVRKMKGLPCLPNSPLLISIPIG